MAWRALKGASVTVGQEYSEAVDQMVFSFPISFCKKEQTAL